MWVTCVFGARGGRFFRAAPTFPEFVQIHVLRSAWQVLSQLVRGGVCKWRPFVFWHGDRKTRHRGRKLTREMELRHGLIDLPGTV